jgi:hypothetical protein
MTYQADQAMLRTRFHLDRDCEVIEERQLIVECRWFESAAANLLPGARSYRCDVHGSDFTEQSPTLPNLTEEPSLLVPDARVKENQRFRFATYRDSRQPKSRGIIVLLHGLNERDWGKYLTWAQQLVHETGKAVVLFPLALHMNRSPDAWGNPRIMQKVSNARHKAGSTIANSTFANAAISTRLHAQPERFCWSGLQTLFDLSQFVTQVRRGAYDTLDADASVDLFAYSIGAFLGEILVMANPERQFDKCRLFMFCGGATLDRMCPNSRYILDSDATIALYSYFLARFANELRNNVRLAHYVDGSHEMGHFFRAMLDYQEGKEVRERRLLALSGRLAALSLKRDRVMPANEIVNTLQGDFREIPISVTVRDFPYSYDHIVPFPTKSAKEEVELCFRDVFRKASEFLG